MSDAPESRADAWVEAAPAGSPARALRERAREWADRVSAATGMSGGWRMQVLSLRTRRDFRSVTAASGDPASPLTTSFGTPAYAPPSDQVTECPDRPMRLRRYVSGCPWPIVEQVVRYLHAVAPYTGVVFDGSRTDAVWRPTLTQWTRDAQAQVGQDATCTLVQDLVEVTDCGDEEVVASGASCLQAEETRYVWDASSVEGAGASCPGQGTTVSVQAVRRNEDGTFDYQVVVSRARSRHEPAHAVHCDASRSATEERWENLYGEPGSLRASGLGEEPAPCDGLSAGESLPGLAPASCSQASAGTTVRWEVQLNRDCTYSVSKTVSSAKKQSGSWSDADGCRVSSHETKRGSASAPPSVQSASPGTRVDIRATLADDGTWSWERTETTAPESMDAEWHDGTPCRPRTVTHRLAARTLSDATAAIPARSVGQVVDAQVSRNQDCTWDARVAVTKAPAAGYERWTDGSDCRERRHARGMNYRSFAAAKEAASGEHPLEAGWTVDAQYSRNEDCTWDFTSVKARATVAWSADWDDGSECRPRENRVRTGLASLGEAKRLAYGMQAGRTVQTDIRMDDDCTWTLHSTRSATSPAWDADWTDGSECRPRSNRRRSGLATKAAALSYVHEVEAGYSVQADVRMAEDCSWEVSSSKARTSPEADSVSWTDGTKCRPRTVSRHMGLASKEEAEALVPDPEAGHSYDVQLSRNDDCTWDAVVSDVDSTALAVDETFPEGSSCRPGTVHVVRSSSSRPAISAPSQGQVVRVGSVSLNPDCTWDATWTVTEPAQEDSFDWSDGSANASTVHRGYSDVRQVVQPDAATPGVTVRASWRRNEDCTYSGVNSVTTASACQAEWDDGAECGGKTSHVAYSHVANVVPPQPSGQKSVASGSWRCEEDGTYSGVNSVTTWEGGETRLAASWESEERSPTHRYTYSNSLRGFSHADPYVVQSYLDSIKGASVSVDLRLEADCTYSGTVGARTLKEWVVDGSGGDGGLASGSFTRDQYCVVGGTFYKRTLTYNTDVFKGSGNASASTLSGYDEVVGWGTAICGIKLSSDTGWVRA